MANYSAEYVRLYSQERRIGKTKELVDYAVSGCIKNIIDAVDKNHSATFIYVKFYPVFTKEILKEIYKQLTELGYVVESLNELSPGSKFYLMKHESCTNSDNLEIVKIIWD